MIYLTERQTEKMRLWLDLKPKMILIGASLLFFENIVGARTPLGILPGYVALLIVYVIGIATRHHLRRGKMPLALANFSFLIDSFVIIGGIYFHGGLETPWVFSPSFVTFMGAYVFGLFSGVFYAAFTVSLLISMYYLEYFRIIPHFPIYSLPDLYWRGYSYFFDQMTGIFFFQFAMAISVGLLSRLTDKRNERIEEQAKELQKSLSVINSVQADVERALRMVREKTDEVERNLRIIADREKEIADTEQEIERVKRGEVA